MNYAADPCANLSPALIVDDDAAVRARLEALLGSLGIGAIESCGDVAAARRACGRGRFALGLIDIGLPDGSGLDLLRWLRPLEAVRTPIVVSAFGAEDTVVAALRLGAHGYLLKEREDVELAASLRSIAQGGAPLDPMVARHLLRLVEAGQAPIASSDAANEPDAGDGADLADTGLTPRELEILNLVARGLISREIAQRLARSPLTIECHIKNIFRKIGASTRTQAVDMARQRGLLR